MAADVMNFGRKADGGSYLIGDFEKKDAYTEIQEKYIQTDLIMKDPKREMCLN
jgi:hypothetical protein